MWGNNGPGHGVFLGGGRLRDAVDAPSARRVERSSEAICKLGTHLKTYRKLSGNSNHAEQRRTARDRPSEVTVVEGASPLMKGLSQFLHEIMTLGCEADISNLQPAVAQLITKGLKVEVTGNNVCNHENWRNDKDWYPGFIKEVRQNGKFEVEFDRLTLPGGKTPWTKVLTAVQFRIL